MSNAKKIVVKLDLHDNKDKQKALKAVSVLVGIDAISVDMAAHKMTVIGTVDPVDVVSKLRSKSWAAHIDSIGPAKEPEKKEEKKEDGGGEKKDGEGKKEEGDAGKKDGEGKKEEGDGKKEEGDGKKDGEGKKEDGEGKKEDDGKKEEDGKKDDKKEEGEKKPVAVAPPWMHQLPPQYTHMLTADYMNQYHRPPPPPPVYHPYVPPPPQQYYYMRNMSMEENPNSCAIL